MGENYPMSAFSPLSGLFPSVVDRVLLTQLLPGPSAV
jgi:hypothetical protein